MLSTVILCISRSLGNILLREVRINPSEVTLNRKSENLEKFKSKFHWMVLFDDHICSAIMLSTFLDGSHGSTIQGIFFQQVSIPVGFVLAACQPYRGWACVVLATHSPLEPHMPRSPPGMNTLREQTDTCKV